MSNGQSINIKSLREHEVVLHEYRTYACIMYKGIIGGKGTKEVKLERYSPGLQSMVTGINILQGGSLSARRVGRRRRGGVLLQGVAYASKGPMVFWSPARHIVTRRGSLQAARVGGRILTYSNSWYLIVIPNESMYQQKCRKTRIYGREELRW